jgi:hypothetical protein
MNRSPYTSHRPAPVIVRHIRLRFNPETQLIEVGDADCPVPHPINHTLDKLRRKRNVGSYDDYGLVSQSEADVCGKMAVHVRKEVEHWIRKNHADKMV